MLPQRNRLRSSREFTATTRGGRRYATGCLVVHLLTPKDASLVAPKLGLTVGKSVGNAVARHRLSRQLRHAAAVELARLPNGSSMVVRALPGAESATSQDLARYLHAAFDVLTGRASS